ncbi:hypothetical protein Bca4012_050951 [Brassica carinata]
MENNTLKKCLSGRRSSFGKRSISLFLFNSATHSLPRFPIPIDFGRLDSKHHSSPVVPVSFDHAASLLHVTVRDGSGPCSNDGKKLLFGKPESCCANFYSLAADKAFEIVN